MPRPAVAGALGRGDTVGRYVVLEQVGLGGMGVVYAAYDPSLDRKVALKLLRLDRGAAQSVGEARARLVREAQAMARLSHPNVVAVHDVGMAGEQVFVAMDYVHGETLEEWLGRAPRSWREVVAVFRQAARGLAAAHAAGIVHRDFKPANVIVGRDGRVQVTDFGLARQIVAAAEDAARPVGGTRPAADAVSSGELDSPLTRVGAVCGTAGLIAPEQADGGDVDARTDQYSFCVALFQALYGAPPFAGPLRLETADCQEPAGSAEVPRRLFRVVKRGLAYHRERRFPSMDALLAELERDPVARRRRHTAVALVAAAAAAAVGGGIAFVALGPRPCQGLEQRLAGVWDAGRKEEVHRALAASGVPYAEASWLAVERALDDYGARWVAAASDACAATRVRGEQSEALLDRRMDCLNQRLAALEALGRLGRALAIKRATLRPDHPSVAFTLLTRGDHLLRLDRHREALADYRAAVEILDRSPAAAEDDLGRALTGVGEAEVELGQPQRAVAPLERALARPGFAASDAVEAAWAELQLARARWGSGGDRAEALRLARHARDVLAGAQPPRPADLATVTAWLDAHAGAAPP